MISHVKDYNQLRPLRLIKGHPICEVVGTLLCLFFSTPDLFIRNGIIRDI
jgi:hypothetical protein